MVKRDKHGAEPGSWGKGSVFVPAFTILCAVQCQDRLLCRAAFIFYEFLIKFCQDISLSTIRLVDVID